MRIELSKEVNQGLSLICKVMGYKKKQYCYVKPIDDNVTAVLAFGKASYAKRGHIYVSASVGVSYKNVEQLYAKLVGGDESIFSHTIIRQIGGLMPQESYKEWDFVKDADNTPLFEDLQKSIQLYGFPYQEKMRRFDNLLQSFERRDPGILYIARDRYLPILYYMKGDKQKGLQAIEEAIEREKQPISEETMKRLLTVPPGAKSVQVIIGNPDGTVDPEYLKFVERYKLLQEPSGTV